MASRKVFDLFRLNGRRALVTGGSKGLGRIFATTLAEAGADVLVVSRTQVDCDATAREIASQTGRNVVGVAADVSQRAAVDELVERARESLGPIDILVNSAGINARGPIADLHENDWDDVLNTNLKAPFLLARRFGPLMAARGWGRIIHLGSILSTIGIAGRTPYASSKTGLLGLTRVLALEWATNGVTVNAICPGPFATDMNKPLLNDPVQYQAFVAKIPMGRWGELEEIAGAALFLASDASSYMTGTTLYVDGGWTAQ
jgi:NAD(P)-dependent dehydrogenase (short-subunit alcohol dehydrogenase family)